MQSRRLILTGLATAIATPLLAQGKKDGATAGDGLGRDSGSVNLIGIDGDYLSMGMNPDGSTYEGTVAITQQGTAIEVSWTINGETNRGAGLIDGRVVVVDWGDETPVVYVVMPNGALHGTWADGTALEKLIPR